MDVAIDGFRCIYKSRPLHFVPLPSAYLDLILPCLLSVAHNLNTIVSSFFHDYNSYYRTLPSDVEAAHLGRTINDITHSYMTGMLLFTYVGLDTGLYSDRVSVRSRKRRSTLDSPPGILLQNSSGRNSSISLFPTRFVLCQ